jgi:hypothetical protein
MCGRLPILIARYASKRFQWLMAMIGLPTDESLFKVGFVDSPVAPLIDVRLVKEARQY